MEPFDRQGGSSGSCTHSPSEAMTTQHHVTHSRVTLALMFFGKTKLTFVTTDGCCTNGIVHMAVPTDSTRLTNRVAQHSHRGIVCSITRYALYLGFTVVWLGTQAEGSSSSWLVGVHLHGDTHPPQQRHSDSDLPCDLSPKSLCLSVFSFAVVEEGECAHRLCDSSVRVDHKHLLVSPA